MTQATPAAASFSELTVPVDRAPILYILLFRGFLMVICFGMVFATTLIALTTSALSDKLVAPAVGLLFALIGIASWRVADGTRWGLALDEAGFTCTYPFMRQRRALWRDVKGWSGMPGTLNTIAVFDVGQRRPIFVQGWYKMSDAAIIATMEAYRRHAVESSNALSILHSAKT